MLIAHYFTPDRYIHIKNRKGKTIVKRKYLKPGNYFTLPDQKIKTRNRLRLIKKTKPNFKLLDVLFRYLPPERNYKADYVNISKSYTESDKACIYPGLKEIYIHPKFLDGLNEVEKKLVLFHEVGHFFYKTEAKADLFAATILYILGYSPRAITRASKETLSITPSNVKRWKILIKYLKEAKR